MCAQMLLKARSSGTAHAGLGKGSWLGEYVAIPANPILNFQCDAMQSRKLMCALNLLMRVMCGAKKANISSTYSSSDYFGDTAASPAAYI